MVNITKLMNDRIVGIEMSRRIGVGISNEEMQKYKNVPFSTDELKDAASKGFFLVAMPRVSLLDLQAIGAVKFYAADWDPNWYRQSFEVSYSRPGYHLLGKLQDSNNKLWQAQSVMQPNGYEVPYAAEVAYLCLAWTTAFRRVPFTDWVRCGDKFIGETSHHLAVEGYPPVAIDWPTDSYPADQIYVASGKYRATR
jgi:hypothetical protein